jgi:hypothetical protein
MTLRLFFAAVWLASYALAVPPLTTIQDVLYKADGTRFNGTVTISWTSFQAMDNSTIATQSTTVKIVDGNLRVQLVPTTTSTPATYYSVKYNSNGRIQFAETWSVPSSAQPLHVRDVRVATASNTAAPDTGGGASTPAQETDIVGLIADLGARPLKGPGYAAGRVAVVNPLGALESVTGSATDCVRVDGSSGPCGGLQPSFVDGDSPNGLVDGSNTSFTLSAVPDPASSLAVYRNGMLQKTGQDYTLTGSTIQFVAAAAPQPGDTLLAGYRLTGTGSDTGTTSVFPNPQVLCSGTGAATGNTLSPASEPAPSRRDSWRPATAWRSASISRTRARLRASPSRSSGAQPPSCSATPAPGTRSPPGGPMRPFWRQARSWTLNRGARCSPSALPWPPRQTPTPAV